jgi:hypothetical protein
VLPELQYVYETLEQDANVLIAAWDEEHLQPHARHQLRCVLYPFLFSSGGVGLLLGFLEYSHTSWPLARASMMQDRLQNCSESDLGAQSWIHKMIEKFVKKKF